MGDPSPDELPPVAVGGGVAELAGVAVSPWNDSNGLEHGVAVGAGAAGCASTDTMSLIAHGSTVGTGVPDGLGQAVAVGSDVAGSAGAAGRASTDWITLTPHGRTVGTGVPDGLGQAVAVGSDVAGSAGAAGFASTDWITLTPHGRTVGAGVSDGLGQAVAVAVATAAAGCSPRITRITHGLMVGATVTVGVGVMVTAAATPPTVAKAAASVRIKPRMRPIPPRRATIPLLHHLECPPG